MKDIIPIAILMLLFIGCTSKTQNLANQTQSSTQVTQTPQFKIGENLVLSRLELDEGAWKEELNEMEYYVLREKGTERAFTGEYWDNKEDGIYVCNGCNLPLYSSETKFKSGTGWPSYYAPIEENRIATSTDYDIGYARTEILCARCDGHLGHVFDDGPPPTGKRHCVNSVSLRFIKKGDYDTFLKQLD